jgi:pilus assembly protein FimV
VGHLAPAAPTPVVPVKAAEPESAVEPRRPMSAEELIDLEQQAEFFVVLGQDEAAIDLLMGHVRSTGGVSPLPYLKLLEIYRRRGEREPYDRIRERFNRRFNAYAPEWDVDPELGLSLEGYPEVMQRLQDTWNRPSQAMGLLDAALFRRDAGPTFDVPAYRELLFLYSTARDLAERDVDVEGVDLLLPIGDVPSSTMTSVAASSPEVADPPASFSLDLDVSTDQPPLTLEDLEPKDLRKNGR